METELIFKNLIWNHEYATKVFPYLKQEFFSDRVDREIFDIYSNHVGSYNEIPTVDVIKYELSKSRKLHTEEYKRAESFVESLSKPYSSPDIKYLLDTTEEWCQYQSLHNAIQESIMILDDSSKTPRTAIIDIVKDSLNVTFNTNIGHDYLNDVEERYQKNREKKNTISSGIKFIDECLGGGFQKKCLYLYMLQSGGGKSLIKCFNGCEAFKSGKNVLYVTLELSEERIGERQDANLMNIDVKDLLGVPLETYKKKVKEIGEKYGGRMVVKEFPPASTTAAHLRALLNELKLKKNFIPDIMIVDYINCMSSTRYKAASGNNSYTILKAVAEELVGIAKEYDLAVVSSTQLNRSGISSSEPEMTDVSDSMGLVHVCDALFGGVRNDELDSMGKILLKCVKTRFSDMTNRKSLVGVNYNQMKLYDVDNSGTYVAQPTSAPETVKPPKPEIPKVIPKKKFEGIQL